MQYLDIFYTHQTENPDPHKNDPDLQPEAKHCVNKKHLIFISLPGTICQGPDQPNVGPF